MAYRTRIFLSYLIETLPLHLGCSQCQGGGKGHWCWVSGPVPKLISIATWGKSLKLSDLYISICNLWVIILSYENHWEEYDLSRMQECVKWISGYNIEFPAAWQMNLDPSSYKDTQMLDKAEHLQIQRESWAWRKTGEMARCQKEKKPKSEKWAEADAEAVPWVFTGFSKFLDVDWWVSGVHGDKR